MPSAAKIAVFGLSRSARRHMPPSLRPIRFFRFRVLLGLLGLLLSVLLAPAGATDAQGAPMNFTLLDVEGTRLRWTPAGPGAGTPPSAKVLGGGFSSKQRVSAAVVRADGQETYYLTGNGGQLAWQLSAADAPVRDTPGQDVPPAPNLPRLSWATGLAWDETRGVLAIVSTGSDAQFYRFDTRARRWLDARPINSPNIASLAFNAATGGFAAVSNRADLVLLDARGTLEEVRPLDGVLPQLAEARQPETHNFAGLQVFADGDRFALVNVLRGRVTHVWTYDRATRRASLTYKSGGLTPAASLAPSAPAAPPVAAAATQAAPGIAWRQLATEPALWLAALSPATEARLYLGALWSGGALLGLLVLHAWRPSRGGARALSVVVGLVLAALPALMIYVGSPPGARLLLGPMELLQCLKLTWVALRLGVPLAQVLAPLGYLLVMPTAGLAALLIALGLLLRMPRRRVLTSVAIGGLALLAALQAREFAARRAVADVVARETAAGEALFAARCQSAGARRPYPIGGVDGVRLDDLRGEVASTAHADRDWPDAGIPGEAGGMAYVRAFLDVEIDDRRDHPGWSLGIDSSRVTLKGYDFVDVRQPDGSYLRHRLAADQTLVTAPIPTDEAARYAVSYLPHGYARDRMHWVAGALVRVTDTRSGQLLGELEAYAHQPPPRRGGGDLSRRSWHGARTCPAYDDVPGFMVRMFTEHVLQRPR